MQTELIPVIHMVNKEQVFSNVELCLANDIEKVFLINHATSALDLMNCAADVRQKFPVWVGVNLLGMNIWAAIRLKLAFDGLWCDQSLSAEDNKNRRFAGLLFTGVAFKYQPQPQDLKAACEEAKQLTDVVTTSGVGTGHAADTEKIKLMREYLGDHPLAIASGVTPENVLDYKGLANYLLVASSFTDYKERIIPEKLKALREKL
jgi:hypothetical protein